MTGDRIPDDVVDRVRAATDIVELVGADLALTKDGADMKALCPFHEEKTASFKVNAARQRFKCFGCGAGGDAFDWLVKRRGIPFPAAVRALAAEKGVDVPVNGNDSSKPTAVADRAWDICDALGYVVATHVRRDLPNGKKRFLWKRGDRWNLRCTVHADADAAGCANCLGGKDLPLYGTELLAGRPDERVLITEGEKAADAARARGALALGTVTGSSSEPGSASLAVLLGRDVLLWPDHDEGGYEHMRRIAASLDGVARSVRVVHWAGATEKGDDAADFDGSDDEFRAVLDAAILCAPTVPARELGPDDDDGYVPTPPGALVEAESPVDQPPADPVNAFTPSGFKWIRGDDLLNEPEAQVDFLLPGLIAAGHVLGLAGGPKIGKSWWMYALLGSLSRGEGFMGHPAPPAPVRAVIVSEEPKSRVRAKLFRFGVVGAIILPRGAIPSDASWDEVCVEAGDVADREGCGLVFFDTLSGLAGIENENDQNDTNRAMRPLLSLVGTHPKIALVFSHHAPKAVGLIGKHVRAVDYFRGSGAIAANPDALAAIDLDGDMTSPRRILLSEGRFDVPAERLIVEYVARDGDTPATYRLLGSAAARAAESASARELAKLTATDDKIVRILERIFEEHPVDTPWITRKDFPELYGKGWKEAESRLHVLARDLQRIQRIGGGFTKGDPLRYAALGAPLPSPKPPPVRKATRSPTQEPEPVGGAA